MQNDLIIVSDYCDKCHIEPSFIELLQENGLIDILFDEGRPCLTYEQLPDVERYSRMYYDLSINVEGIDAIRHLLTRVESLQERVRTLENELRFYRR